MTLADDSHSWDNGNHCNLFCFDFPFVWDLRESVLHLSLCVLITKDERGSTDEKGSNCPLSSHSSWFAKSSSSWENKTVYFVSLRFFFCLDIWRKWSPQWVCVLMKIGQLHWQSWQNQAEQTKLLRQALNFICFRLGTGLAFFYDGFQHWLVRNWVKGRQKIASSFESWGWKNGKDWETFDWQEIDLIANVCPDVCPNMGRWYWGRWKVMDLSQLFDD